ncbi:hypothetical protein BS78_09G108000 [Paspalum vaginatum]|nr:hypothetical protein BS78_09G108000 [Paspalum vaginatum]
MAGPTCTRLGCTSHGVRADRRSRGDDEATGSISSGAQPNRGWIGGCCEGSCPTRTGGHGSKGRPRKQQQ